MMSQITDGPTQILRPPVSQTRRDPSIVLRVGYGVRDLKYPSGNQFDHASGDSN